MESTIFHSVKSVDDGADRNGKERPVSLNTLFISMWQVRHDSE